MQDKIKKASEQLTGKWSSLSSTKKIGIGTAAGAIIIGAGIGINALLTPDMEVLYRGLDLKDSSEITQVLDSSKIEYDVKDGGTTIELNSSDINKAKLLLASENIPKSGYTFDDAITNSMSTTEDEKRAKMNEYKKAEIEKALKSMSNIRDAKVTLDIPKEKNSFIESKQKSSASVLLTLTGSLNSKQVSGIARFIASSVENLDTSNITIIDTDGNNLFSGEDSESFDASKQQEIKTSAENSIKTKVTDLLAPLFDDLTVSTNLILDFNTHEEVREEYTPQFDGDGKGIIKSESTSNQSTSDGSSAAGEPGTASNTGQATSYQSGSSSNSQSISGSKDTEYVNNKIISSSVKNVGDIDYKKSSIAVNVFKYTTYDEIKVSKTLEDKTWDEFKAEKREQIPLTIDESLITQIKNGTGIDNVVIYGYEKPIFIDKAPFVFDIKNYIPYALLLGSLLLVIITKFTKKPKVTIETEPELEVEEMLSVNKKIQSAQTGEELSEIELRETLETKKRIEQFVDEKPEAVAQLLRNWLMEEEDWD